MLKQANTPGFQDAPMSKRTWSLCTIAMILTIPTGCIPQSKPGFDSPAPSKRLDAIISASALEDDESFIKLVEKLRSESPAERMLAIRSLQTRTGTTLEYNHAAPDWQRLQAYNRWIDYMHEHGIQTRPTLDDEETNQNDPID